MKKKDRCIICGAEFEGTSANDLFCSDECFEDSKI